MITFPNARYMFHKGDWDHFTDPGHLDRQDPQSRLAHIADTCLLPISDAKQMELVTTDANVTSEVKILHTPGHTPGSVSVLVESGGESVIFIGDVAHLCVQLTEYDWSPLGDVDRETSPESRERVVEEAVRRNALVAGPHLEEGPGFRPHGHAERPPRLAGRRRASAATNRRRVDKGGSVWTCVATTRREALRWLGLTAVGSLLAACAQPAPSAPPQAAPTAPPAASARSRRRPPAHQARGGHQRPSRGDATSAPSRRTTPARRARQKPVASSRSA